MQKEGRTWGTGWVVGDAGAGSRKERATRRYRVSRKERFSTEAG